MTRTATPDVNPLCSSPCSSLWSPTKLAARAPWVGFVAAMGIGCSPAPLPTTSAPVAAADDTVEEHDALVQFSLLSALAAGDFAEGEPMSRILAGGDFGLGTFDRLDGEMIVLDGKVFQASADGIVRPAAAEATTPFAAVTFFRDDGRIDGLNAASLTDLDEQLDRKLARRNTPYAIRIDSEFAELTLRSVPAQTAPYRPLVDVIKHQVIREYRGVRGTLVGLRCPAWMGAVNVSGYHWHFLSDDRTIGGHVFGCAFQGATLRFDECKSVVIHLPQSDEFDRFDARSIQAHDIDKIERQRK